MKRKLMHGSWHFEMARKWVIGLPLSQQTPEPKRLLRTEAQDWHQTRWDKRSSNLYKVPELDLLRGIGILFEPNFTPTLSSKYTPFYREVLRGSHFHVFESTLLKKDQECLNLYFSNILDPISFSLIRFLTLADLLCLKSLLSISYSFLLINASDLERDLYFNFHCF